MADGVLVMGRQLRHAATTNSGGTVVVDDEQRVIAKAATADLVGGDAPKDAPRSRHDDAVIAGIDGHGGDGTHKESLTVLNSC